MLEKAGADAARLQTHRAAVPESGAAEADEGRHDGRISQHLRRLAHIAPRPASTSPSFACSPACSTIDILRAAIWARMLTSA